MNYRSPPNPSSRQCYGDFASNWTRDPDHLRANIASLLAPPLPLANRLTLTKLFGRLSGVGLDPPYGIGLP